MTWSLIATLVFLGGWNFTISFLTLKRLSVKMKIAHQFIIVFLWASALILGNALMSIIYL